MTATTLPSYGEHILTPGTVRDMLEVARTAALLANAQSQGTNVGAEAAYMVHGASGLVRATVHADLSLVTLTWDPAVCGPLLGGVMPMLMLKDYSSDTFRQVLDVLEDGND